MLRVLGSLQSHRLGSFLVVMIAMQLQGWERTGHAETVQQIRSAAERPVLVRGSVLMLPLTAGRPGDGWPATMELTWGRERTMVGTVAWLEPAAALLERRWTDDPRSLHVRAVRPDDDSRTLEASGGYGPYLLAEIPEDGAGELRLGQQKMKPHWVDQLQVRVVASSEIDAADDLGPDHPDPNSPFEYWRRVVLAERAAETPPPPPGDELQRMAGQSIADLWRVGLARLRRGDPAAAQVVIDQLTRTASDRGQRFAAWVTDPQRLSDLLNTLLTMNRRDEEIAADAMAWASRTETIMFWPHAEHGPQVQVNVCSLQAEPLPATLRWRDDDGPPLRAILPPRVLTTITVSRPPLPSPAALGLPAPPEPARHTLLMGVSGREYEINVGVRQVTAKPPGVFFRPLMPPLSLDEAWGVQAWRDQVTGGGSRREGMPASRATLVHVRRLGGRWEVFFDCRRLQRDPAMTTPPRTVEQVQTFEHLRALEAITLLLGEDDGREPAIWLTIPEHGYPLAIRGGHDGTLQIHKKSHTDRWLCRVVLPEAWFSAAETSPAFIGFLRSHGDGDQLETAPNASVPWRPWPSRAALVLDQWDDLPRER